MGSMGSREAADERPDEDAEAACNPPPRLGVRAERRPRVWGIRRTVRTPFTCSSCITQLMIITQHDMNYITHYNILCVSVFCVIAGEWYLNTQHQTSLTLLLPRPNKVHSSNLLLKLITLSRWKGYEVFQWPVLYWKVSHKVIRYSVRISTRYAGTDGAHLDRYKPHRYTSCSYASKTTQWNCQ